MSGRALWARCASGTAKTQSFEEVSYEGYKANREAMPEDLRRQIPYIRRALEALRIPILEAEGFEADDVIGTLAREAAEQGHEVFIVSGDKDMMQLVTPQVRILNPQKDNLILDPAKVTETAGRAAGKSGGRDGAARRCGGQHSGRAGDWRQGQRGFDCGVRQRGSGAGPRRRR